MIIFSTSFPKAGYYHDYLDTRLLYEKWEPYIFDFTNPHLNLPANDPHVLGAMFAEWNDKLGSVVSDADVYARVKPAAQTIGEKLWSGTDQDITYDQFEQLADPDRRCSGTIPVIETIAEAGCYNLFKLSCKSGRVNQNVVPLPGMLCIPTCP